MPARDGAPPEVSWRSLTGGAEPEPPKEGIPPAQSEMYYQLNKEPKKVTVMEAQRLLGMGDLDKSSLVWANGKRGSRVWG
eukprot:COSAG02_NODE_15307_length_1182_cov_4.186519_1_plen_80_part_00